MASRFSLNVVVLPALMLVSVFFILPDSVFAQETADIHARLTTAIIDRYNTTAIEKISDDERAWIAWGVAHEGIPARALHHKEQTWAHDSMRQSARVYDGVYTWEQGMYDSVRGDRTRALQTLGHLLHLVIDAHPLALATPLGDMHGVVWRDVIQRSSADDMQALLSEGGAMIERFFRASSITKEQVVNDARVLAALQPATRTNFPLRMLRSIVGTLRGKTQRIIRVASDSMRTAFARMAPIALGGVRTSESPVVARAEEKVEESKTIVRPRHLSPPPLPLAQSVAALSPDPMPLPLIIAEEAPPALRVETVPPPVFSEAPLIIPTDPPPTAILVEPIEPEKPPAVDYLGFPIGYIPRAGPAPTDTAPPDTTLTQSPPILTNSASATFVFAASEDKATFHFMLDGGAWQSAVSPLTIADLADGEHTVIIRATDPAGNVDPTPASATWTVDTVVPVSPALTSPTTGASYTTIANTVTLTGTREDGAMIAIDGSSDSITTPTEATWQKIITLALGTTTLSMTVTDAAGNVSAPTILTITRTDNHAPTTITNLSITTPVVANDRMTLTWTAPSDTDIPTQTLAYTIRYATTPITDDVTWGSATAVAEPLAVGIAGAPETFTITGLTPATTYYFAIRTSDGELLSALSNVPGATTHYGVHITDAHFQGGVSEEYIMIKNERADDQSLQGWKLYDAATTPHTYTFGVLTLAAGTTVTVYTGTGANTATDLYWNRASSVWNDDHDTASLKDAGGTLIDAVQW